MTRNAVVSKSLSKISASKSQLYRENISLAEIAKINSLECRLSSPRLGGGGGWYSSLKINYKFKKYHSFEIAKVDIGKPSNFNNSKIKSVYTHAHWRNKIQLKRSTKNSSYALLNFFLAWNNKWMLNKSVIKLNLDCSRLLPGLPRCFQDTENSNKPEKEN